MFRDPIGSAVRNFLEKLEEGDPVALGLLGFGVLLAAVAGGIWRIDRRNQEKEKTKGRWTSRGR